MAERRHLAQQSVADRRPCIWPLVYWHEVPKGPRLPLNARTHAPLGSFGADCTATPRVSELVGPGRGPRLCIFPVPPGGARNRTCGNHRPSLLYRPRSALEETKFIFPGL